MTTVQERERASLESYARDFRSNHEGRKLASNWRRHVEYIDDQSLRQIGVSYVINVLQIDESRLRDIIEESYSLLPFVESNPRVQLELDEAHRSQEENPDGIHRFWQEVHDIEPKLAPNSNLSFLEQQGEQGAAHFINTISATHTVNDPLLIELLAQSAHRVYDGQ